MVSAKALRQEPVWCHGETQDCYDSREVSKKDAGAR